MKKTLYASGGNDNFILAFSINKNKIGSADTIVLGKPWPNPICPTGIAVNRANTLLYTVTKEDSFTICGRSYHPQDHLQNQTRCRGL